MTRAGSSSLLDRCRAGLIPCPGGGKGGSSTLRQCEIRKRRPRMYQNRACAGLTVGGVCCRILSNHSVGRGGYVNSPAQEGGRTVRGAGDLGLMREPSRSRCALGG